MGYNHTMEAQKVTLAWGNTPSIKVTCPHSVLIV